ncbi:unnamed protein product [Sphagnum balticum]
MGNGIAHVFAMNGYAVKMVDIRQEALDKAIDTISKNLDRMVAKGSIDANKKTQTLANLTTGTDIATACPGADLVVEAATENIDLKLKIFKQLDEVCKPEAILASNTSSISITRIASVTRRPDKGHRYALYEPGTTHEADRSDTWVCHIGCSHCKDHGPIGPSRQNTGRGE